MIVELIGASLGDVIKNTVSKFEFKSLLI